MVGLMNGTSLVKILKINCCGIMEQYNCLIDVYITVTKSINFRLLGL